MSDEAASSSVVPETAAAPVAQQAPAVQQASAGTLLRQAREAAGIDLPSLAATLKVSPKKLEALEADRLEQLPDAVFLRGLASSVCRSLKIDAAPVLSRLPQSTAPRLAYDEAGLNTPFNSPGDVAKTPFLDRLSRPMVLAALAVLMGALVLIFFPSHEQRAELGAIVARAPQSPAATGTSEPSEPALQPVEVVPAAVPAKASVTAPVPPVRDAAPQAEVKPAATVPTPVSTPVPVAKPAPVAVAPVPAAVASSPEAPVRKKVTSTGIVVFKTSGPSWIEVTDAKGAIQLSRQVEPGEPVGASGPLPLNVTIGRADVTEVQVRGKPYPLEPVTKQGVARFEVK